MSLGWVVTGTDTGVGKTVVTVSLMRALRHRGLRVSGMKPVASGGVETAEGMRSEDALLIAAAASAPVPYSTLNPYLFAPPIAPHLAAAEAHREIAWPVIQAAFAELRAEADAVLVEGVGGWRVPLGATLELRDIAARLRLGVILVVGLRLGCLNHAILSAEAIRADGLRLCGWVANAVDPGFLRPHQNIETLRQRLGAPLLGVLPWQAAPDPGGLQGLLAAGVDRLLDPGYK